MLGRRGVSDEGEEGGDGGGGVGPFEYLADVDALILEELFLDEFFDEGLFAEDHEEFRDGAAAGND